VSEDGELRKEKRDDTEAKAETSQADVKDKHEDSTYDNE